MLFFNKIRLKLIKNDVNIDIIIGGIIKYKISKFIFKAILLNKLQYNLLSNNLTYYMQ